MTDLSQSSSCHDHFKTYRPNTRGNAARITEKQWEPFFPLIRRLHHARQTRTQILRVLCNHGLEPSLAQLYARMSRWGLKGHGSAAGNSKDDMVMAEMPTDHVDDAAHLQNEQSAQSPSDQSFDHSADDSQPSSNPANCFSHHNVDTSDTLYDTDGPPTAYNVKGIMLEDMPDYVTMADVQPAISGMSQSGTVGVSTIRVDHADPLSKQYGTVHKLIPDLMTFVHSATDIGDFDKHDILNEVAAFMCTTNSFSDASVLLDAGYSFLKENEGAPMALVFATMDCLRSATFREQCQYAGSLMGEALASVRLVRSANPLATTTLSSLEEIGRDLCATSDIGVLSILYSHPSLPRTSSAQKQSAPRTNEILFHHSDPFLHPKTDDQPDLFNHSIDASSTALARIVGKLSRWCCSAADDFNPISMLPSAGFNPSDPMSVARFATALSCHFVRKWSLLSLSEVLGHCNELLAPNRKDAAIRLCKTAVRVLSTLAVYTIYQATGSTLRSVSDDCVLSPEDQAQFVSPLSYHLDTLSRMGSKERVLIFAATYRTLYNRTLSYRQQMVDHCLTAHVRETGFYLAASLIRIKRELNIETTRPTYEISRIQSPMRDNDGLSRRSSDSSSSMRDLARRNLLVPGTGTISRSGSHMRSSWTRRLSTDSNESWNFTAVTGLPVGPSPPESVHGQIRCDDDDDDDEYRNGKTSNLSDISDSNCEMKMF